MVVGQRVMARNVRPGPNWVPATILEVLGPVSYLIETDDRQIWKHHADQLKPFEEQTLSTESAGETEFPVIPHSESEDESTSTPHVSESTAPNASDGVNTPSSGEHQESTLHYPRCVRCPPDRFEWCYYFCIWNISVKWGGMWCIDVLCFVRSYVATSYFLFCVSVYLRTMHAYLFKFCQCCPVHNNKEILNQSTSSQHSTMLKHSINHTHHWDNLFNGTVIQVVLFSDIVCGFRWASIGQSTFIFIKSGHAWSWDTGWFCCGCVLGLPLQPSFWSITYINWTLRLYLLHHCHSD